MFRVTKLRSSLCTLTKSQTVLEHTLAYFREWEGMFVGHTWYGLIGMIPQLEGSLFTPSTCHYYFKQ